ncbi:MAG TPA: cell wall hydrolase [Allosphingosinicella sp.]|nr:cell wall hydrolase [Allosphingosinicella sp.]
MAWELTGTPLTTEISAQPAEVAAPIGAPRPADPAQPEASAAPAPAPAAEPEKPARRSLAELVAAYASTQTADAQHECLAGAVYFESKGEPLQGQLSVAEVILNRARSGRFPASACAVVKQRGQFSFVRGGRFPAIARSSLAWKRAVAIAHIAVQDLADGPAPRALFFHAKRVSPRWRLTRVAAVGNHIFYR